MSKRRPPNGVHWIQRRSSVTFRNHRTIHCSLELRGLTERLAGFLMSFTIFVRELPSAQTQCRLSVLRGHIRGRGGGEQGPEAPWRQFMRMCSHMCSAESSLCKEKHQGVDTDVSDGLSGPVILPLMSRVSAILVPPGLRGDYEKESCCDLSCKGNSNKIYCLVTTEEFL